MFWLVSELLSFWNGNSLVMDFIRVNDIKLTKGAAWRFLKRKDKRSVFVCGN
jgi:hypothetical protein